MGVFLIKKQVKPFEEHQSLRSMVMAALVEVEGTETSSNTSQCWNLQHLLEGDALNL